MRFLTTLNWFIQVHVQGVTTASQLVLRQTGKETVDQIDLGAVTSFPLDSLLAYIWLDVAAANGHCRWNRIAGLVAGGSIGAPCRRLGEWDVDARRDRHIICHHVRVLDAEVNGPFRCQALGRSGLQHNHPSAQAHFGVGLELSE